MPSVDTLAAAVAAVWESLRSVSATLAHARQEGEDLAQALERCGVEGHAQRTRSAVSKLETQQATAAGLEASVNQIQAAVEALRGPDAGGSPPAGRPSSAVPPEPGTRSPSKSLGTQPIAVTRPRFAPDPARRPGGMPTNVEETGGNPTDIRRENEAAKTLAEAGYDIEQNPGRRPNGKAPDYMIDGQWWDCYSPTGASSRTIHTEIRRKVGKSEADRQADRIILNLDGCGASAEEIRARLERSPIRGLQEIKIVKSGKVTQFYPWDTEAEYDGD